MKVTKRKENCWEFMMCGRQPGGRNEKQLGVCPVTREVRLNDVHEGCNAGRACWVVAGSLCGGKTQGAFAQKFKNCERCDFYQKVKQEEGSRFTLSVVLLSLLRNKREMASII